MKSERAVSQICIYVCMYVIFITRDMLADRQTDRYTHHKPTTNQPEPNVVAAAAAAAGDDLGCRQVSQLTTPGEMITLIALQVWWTGSHVTGQVPSSSRSASSAVPGLAVVPALRLYQRSHNNILTSVSK